MKKMKLNTKNMNQLSVLVSVCQALRLERRRSVNNEASNCTWFIFPTDLLHRQFIIEEKKHYHHESEYLNIETAPSMSYGEGISNITVTSISW